MPGVVGVLYDAFWTVRYATCANAHLTSVLAAGNTVTLKVNGSDCTDQVDANGNFSVSA